MATDETGAVYIVTDHRLLRARRPTRPGCRRCAWAAPYDRGTQQKPGQLSQGSGTTPTLIGKDLVAITDNADPRMNVLVLQARRRPESRADLQGPGLRAPAPRPPRTVAGRGRPLGDRREQLRLRRARSRPIGRKTTSPGIARVVLDGDGSAASRGPSIEIAPTSVPKVSLGNGLLYVYSKRASTPLDDSWYFTAIDVRTGRTQWLQRTGNGLQWNNHYASIYLGPDGAAYMPTMAGLVRFEDAG